MKGPSIAIIGGGFSGTALAIHLAKAGSTPVSIFEPRDEIGRGLAYGSRDPVHRINVPAPKMSLDPDHPDDFAEFIAANPQDDADLLASNGDAYPRRSTFGDYVHAQAAPLLAKGLIIHHKALIAKAERRGDLWLLQDAKGGIYQADILVLAASHPSASIPKALHKIVTDRRVFRDGLEAIAPKASVLVIGTGLSAADAIASLLARGHSGPITAVSRRGLRSRGHGRLAGSYEGDFTQKGQTALSLLRKTRAEIGKIISQGGEWQMVLDRLRAQGQDIWRDLPLKSRRQIVRHLRPYWDVHRFRIAPQVEEALDQAVKRGQLSLFAAHLTQAQALEDGIEISFRRKGADPQTAKFEALILTTGSDHANILESQSLFRILSEAGHLATCPTGLGLLCDQEAQALSQNGAPTAGLYICGPLARGTFGELMGLPQVSQQAKDLAQHILKVIKLQAEYDKTY